MFGAKGNGLQLTIRSVLHYKCFNNNHLPRHIFIIQCSLIIMGSFAQNFCLALSLDKPESQSRVKCHISVAMKVAVILKR